MTTEQAVFDLQRQVQELTAYIIRLQQATQTIAMEPQTEVITQSFYGEQQVYVNTPFQCSAGCVDVNVYVEEAPGKYRKAEPIITYMGSCLTLDFDMGRSGYVVVATTEVNGLSCVDVPYAPLPYDPCFITLPEGMEEPKAEPKEEIKEEPVEEPIEETAPDHGNYERAMRIIE